MKTADFDYDLPPALIAQIPVEPRDSSRLLVLRCADGSVAHRHFRDLPACLRPGDLLVANDSRVIPARLYGRRKDTAARVELLLIAQRALPSASGQLWEVLVKPGRRLPTGACIELDGVVDGQPAKSAAGGSKLYGHVLGRTHWGGRLVRFAGEGDVAAALEAHGLVPLPPYIRTPLADAERYQTVYGRVKGSAAAPTAGLHFTTPLIERLQAIGVELAFVTLHIGLDTFRPVQVEDLAGHEMHSEFAELAPETAAVLNRARRAGRRIIAVGTTAVRVLETAACDDGTVAPYRGWTKLFIHPGYRFKAVDALITNFHLPRSTLLMLVSAFGGRELVLRAYAEAAQLGYRFYSFGDAMLLL